jgi:hypothetical protein
MPYLYSVRDHLRSLETAAQTPHTVTVPGHGPRVEDIAELVTSNKRIVHRVADIVLDCCFEPRMPEEILADVLTKLGADPSDPPAYYLLHPTVFAYLTYLEERQDVEHTIERGRSLWRRL